MTSGERIPALDGLRGFAALLVVIAHLPKVGLATLSPALSGPLGVMLFFILSGFLMAHLYLWTPIDRTACVRYMTARVARVFPLYYLVVIGSYLASLSIGPSFTFYIGHVDFVRLLLFSAHNYVFWSIPPEVQFYFVFLFIWWVVQRGWTGFLLPALLVLIGGVFLLRPILPGISAAGQLQIFLTGMAVAVLRRSFGPLVSRGCALAIQVFGLVAVLAVVTEILPVRGAMIASGWIRDDNAYASIPLALLVGSVLLAYTVDTRFARALFANRVAQRLGAYSFAIYLLHWPVMEGVTVALAPAALSQWIVGMAGLGATVAVSALAYHVYEMPAQKLVRATLPRMLDSIHGMLERRRLAAQ